MDFRSIVNTALDFAGKKINKQTGFFHFHPDVVQGEIAYTSPLYENVLYSLLLCTTKTKEHIEEAQLLLDRILAFQNKDIQSKELGTFPRYISDFPRASGVQDLLHILRAIFVLINEYGVVLGRVRLENLQEALFLLATAICERVFLRKRSLAVYVQAASILAAIDKKFSKDHSGTIEECVKKGMENFSLESVLEKDTLDEVLLSWHLSSAEFPDTFWEKIFSWATLFWHTSFGDMTPSMVQEGYQISPSSYSIYMRLMNGMPLQPSYALLAIGLFIGLLGKERSIYAEKEEHDWLVVKKEQFGFFVTPHDVYKQEIPFFFCITKEHTIVLEIEHMDPLHVYWDEEKSLLKLSFHVHSVENKPALHFYINQQPLVSINVEGKKATTYTTKDTVTLQFDTLLLGIVQKISSGDAIFFGHIQRANRASQVLKKYGHSWSCFDTELFLRKVQGLEATLDVEISFR